MNRKVSIIIPVYNVEKYLRRCIDSIINQTLDNFEIILVNDGSTDYSKYICEEYDEKYNFIKLINQENSGLSEARNTGIENSSGEYLFFIDSDDWCEHNFLDNSYKLLKKQNLDLIVSGYVIDYINDDLNIQIKFDENMEYRHENIGKAIASMDSKGCFNVVWNKIYKRSIIIENNIRFDKNGMPGEDLLFNCDYMKKIKSLSFMKGTYYHYMRQDEDTLVSKYRNNLYEKVKIFILKKKELYKFYNIYDIYISNIYDLYVEYIFACVVNNYRKDCNIKLKEKLKFFKKILEDDEIKISIKNSQKKEFNIRLFKLLYKFNSTILFHFIYYVLIKFRYRYDCKYKKIRNLLMVKQDDRKREK